MFQGTNLFVDDVKVGQAPISVIYIPADYPTIQEGLNAANTVTTVIVSAGTYYENIVWPDTDGIVLISEAGAASTIIDGSNSGRVIYIPQACTLTNATVIDGFTIQNGNNSSKGPGGGIADFCGITIKNNIIKDNFAGGVGGGLHLAVGTPLVFNNLILNNTSNDAGGGIYVFCGAEIRNITIVGNSATGTGGGGIAIVFASGTIIIEDNI
ncbi:MAG: right-handed parallel beta-helix repeat-containing protein, partial [Bacteroidales bacterium]|nr:right-handed parallel beta-helix repeat-containing protein [Bacteroidales bacterium]